jgi:hypothetical protein
MPATKIVAGVGGGDDVCADAGRQERSVCIQKLLQIREPGQVQFGAAQYCLLVVGRLEELERSVGGARRNVRQTGTVHPQSSA